MAIVNDLMVYLNTKFSFGLPILPLAGFPQFMVTLWNRVTTNWSQGAQVPAVVQIAVDSSNPLIIPMGGGTVEAVAASILIQTGGSHSP
jgi:hypothetical protein